MVEGVERLKAELAAKPFSEFEVLEQPHSVRQKPGRRTAPGLSDVIAACPTAGNESLIAEISARGLRKTTRGTGLDRKTIRAILNGKKVKASTLAKVVIRMQSQQD